jgi:CubicO group peptidase (beta-lactamase class C family)
MTGSLDGRRGAALTPAHIDRIGGLFSHWAADAPGGIVALIERGKVVHLRCRGLANLEHGIPVAEDTRYPICSLTKTFTGAACALLHQQGRLDLDAEVRRYVPELAVEAPVTVRHLLNMTSGLRDSIDAMVLRGIWYRYPESLPDVFDLAFAQTTQSFPTGSRYTYSNINFHLAALIIERVTGMAYEAFLADAFWRPLGMNDTLRRDSTTIPVPKLADGYATIPGGGWHKGVWSFGFSGAGSLVSTVGDLVRWQGMFRANEALVAMMAEPGRLSGGGHTQYGLGLSARPYRGVTVQAHGGGVPGYRTMFARIPELDVGVIIFASRDDTDLYAKLRAIVDVVLGEEAPQPVPPLPAIGGRWLNRASGEPIGVACDGGAIRVDKMGVGLTLRPDADGAFEDAWGNFRSVLRVEADGALWLDFGGEVGRYERIEGAVAVSGDVTGLYHCADMRSDAEVFVRDGTLVLRFGLAFRREAEVALEPLAADMFFARYQRPWANHQFAVRFQRHARGVARMVVSSSLLKDTVFTRV